MKPAILAAPAAILLAVAALALTEVTAAAPARAAQVVPAVDPPADIPSVKIDYKTGAPDSSFIKRHEELVAQAKTGGIDLYFAGDSLTDRWAENGAAVWKKEMAPWKAGAFGIGGDRTQHLLWRLKNGELDGVNPKVFVVLIGSNNLFDYKPEQIASGTRAIVQLIAEKFPKARILVLGIFPLDEKPDNPYRRRIKDANAITAKLDNGKNITYLDIGQKFLAPDGTATKEIFPDGAHLSEKGYQIFADAIKPTLKGWLESGAANPSDAASQKIKPVAADQPGQRANKDGFLDGKWMQKHEEYVALAKNGNIDLYFVGDSITDEWHWTGNKLWAEEFGPWNPGNFGIVSDRTQHVLWRLKNGELEGVKPKVFVMLIGNNNIGINTNDQIVAGNAAILKELQTTNPTAKILLLGIFPFGEKSTDPHRQRVKDINLGLAKLADGTNIKFLDLGAKFLSDDGSISKDVMGDFVHPTEKGLMIWADEIKPILTEWLGPAGGE